MLETIFIFLLLFLLFLMLFFIIRPRQKLSAVRTFFKCVDGNCVTASECKSVGGACFSDHNCAGNCKPAAPVFYNCVDGNCVAAENCFAPGDDCFSNSNCDKKCLFIGAQCDPLDISSSVCTGNTICDSVEKKCVTCDPSCAGKSCGQLNACGKYCTGCPDGQTCDLNSNPPACKNNSYQNLNVRGGNIITPKIVSTVVDFGDMKCSPATCPASLSGKCTENGCEYDPSSQFVPHKMFNDSNGNPQVTITQYCELETGGCSGALGNPIDYINKIRELIENGQSIESPVISTTVYAAGATNPLFNGNSALYAYPSFQGTSPYNGIVYEIGVLQSNGTTAYAIVAIVDRCAGYYIKGSNCNSQVAGAFCSVPAATSCDYNTQNNNELIEGGSCIYDSCNDTSQVHSPCAGSNGIWNNTSCKECSASTFCNINKTAKNCDWCASNNHPHIDISLEAFNYLTSDDSAHQPRILSYIKPIKIHAPGEYNNLLGSSGCSLKNSYECPGNNYSYKSRDVTCCCGYGYIFDPIIRQCKTA